MGRCLIYFCLASRYFWAMIYCRTPKEGRWKKRHMYLCCASEGDKFLCEQYWGSSIRLPSKYLRFFLLLWQIVCRSAKPIEMAVKEKISMFCHVEPEQVSTSIFYSSLFKHVGKHTNISVHFCFQFQTVSLICNCFYNFYLSIKYTIAL